MTQETQLPFLKQYYTKAVNIIRRLLSESIQSRYDPEDFVQDALLEILTKYGELNEERLSLLILIARRRLVDKMRAPAAKEVKLAFENQDYHPTVASEYDAIEVKEIILSRFGSKWERRVITLRSEGFNNVEIASLTKVGIRTVERFLEQIRLEESLLVLPSKGGKFYFSIRRDGDEK